MVVVAFYVGELRFGDETSDLYALCVDDMTRSRLNSGGTCGPVAEACEGQLPVRVERRAVGNYTHLVGAFRWELFRLVFINRIRLYNPPASSGFLQL